MKPRIIYSLTIYDLYTHTRYIEARDLAEAVTIKDRLIAFQEWSSGRPVAGYCLKELHTVERKKLFPGA